MISRMIKIYLAISVVALVFLGRWDLVEISNRKQLQESIKFNELQNKYLDSFQKLLNKNELNVTPVQATVMRSGTGRRNPFALPFVPAGEQMQSSRQTELVLQGILWDEQQPAAIIGQKVVSLGAEIRNYIVVEITEKSVWLNDGNHSIELTLPTDKDNETKDE